MGASAIQELQQLENTGYSCHLSCIGHMLHATAFRETYLEGDFKPEEVTDFGRSHKIIIDQMVSKNANPLRDSESMVMDRK